MGLTGSQIVMTREELCGRLIVRRLRRINLSVSFRIQFIPVATKLGSGPKRLMTHLWRELHGEDPR